MSDLGSNQIVKSNHEHQIECVLSVGNIVGESAVWCEQQQALLWVDIVAKQISRYVPATSDYQSWPAPDFPTSIGLCRSGGYVIGLRKNVVFWDGASEFLPFLAIESQLPENRLNEGRIGPDGNLWLGTMQNNLAEDGSLKEMSRDSGAIYRVTPAGEVTQLTENNFGITNTFLWSSEAPGWFITADTLKNQLFRYDYCAQTGKIANRRKFSYSFNRGLPDGSCLDAEGYVWNCRVAGGGCVVRFAPSGEIDAVIDLPCSWPTSCTFGGDRFETLYVTSARIGLSPAQIEENPQEGGLFAINLGIPGLAEHRFDR